jgi:hypothetical protein
MDQVIIDDLKQFIVATVMQATSELRQDIVNLSNRLDGRIDDMGEKLDTISGAVGERFENHEKRITRIQAKITQ